MNTKNTSVELRIMDMIADRLEKGQKRYGSFDLRGPRVLEHEALEEALDLAVYLCARLIQLDDANKEK